MHCVHVQLMLAHVIFALQVVQRIPGRANKDEEGEGHYDKVLAISCHPEKTMLASGSLSEDTAIRVWEDQN